jgi:hypothetical protein
MARNGNGALRHYVTQDDLEAIHESLDRRDATFAAQLEKLSSRLEAQTAAIVSRVETVSAAINERGRVTLPILGSGVVAVAILLGGLRWIITAETGPILTRLESNSVTLSSHSQEIHDVNAMAQSSTSADQRSEVNRKELGSRQDRMESTLTQLLADYQAIATKVASTIIEIESQFKAVSNIENLRWAQQMRQNCEIYIKMNDGKMCPQGAVFFPPSIFREPPG